jgi:hypothetical protein
MMAVEIKAALPADRALVLGRRPGSGYVLKVGRNPDVDAASAPEDIWNGGGLYTGFPTGAAERVRVVSSSAADAAAGTGLRTARMYGYDSDGELLIEDITLNGTTPVLSSGLFYRLSRLDGLTAGSAGANVGAITVAHQNTTANVFAVVPVGSSHTQVGAFTVPAGRVGLITKWTGSASNGAGVGQEVLMSIVVRNHGSGCWRTLLNNSVSTESSGFVLDFDGGLSVPARADIVIRARSATADNIDVTTNFEIYTFPE